MKKVKFFLCTCACIGLLTSCYTAEVVVGHPKPPYIKAGSFKNHHLIGGLISVGHRHDAKKLAGDVDNYVVQHQWSFIDGLVSVITYGLYTPTTTTIFVSNRP
ncbi:MAG: Bor family protein [Tannerellaceae bacterium]|nr:Bor family protein [Tannerellaceae bacterium]